VNKKRNVIINEKTEKYILPLITIFAFLLIWQLVCSTGIIPDNKLQTPGTVFKAFVAKFNDTDPDGATLIENTVASLKITVSGLFLGILVGTPLGLLMGWYKPINNFVKPLFELIRPIPPIGWIPLSIVWIGVGNFAKIAIIFLAAFIPCVLNAYAGIQGTKQVLINVSKTFGASNFYIFRKIGIPSSLPMVFAGMRIAMGNAWGTLVAAELLAANKGLGYMIIMGRQFSRPDIIIVGMIVIGGLGYMFTWIFGKIEDYVIRGQEHIE